MQKELDEQLEKAKQALLLDKEGDEGPTKRISSEPII